MYSSDKKRRKKSHVTEIKDDRSYIKNADVILKKKLCLNRHNTTLHQMSSTVEKTNYLKHTDSYFIHKDTSDGTQNYFYSNNFPVICSHGRFLSKHSVITLPLQTLSIKLITVFSKGKGVSQHQKLMTQQ